MEATPSQQAIEQEPEWQDLIQDLKQEVARGLSRNFSFI